MAKNIWLACKGANYITTLQLTAWRIVEAQETTATRKLVDTIAEQIILEEILEDSNMDIEYLNFHPLLYAPFRHPPLKFGSRFGSRIEKSLWYGSLDLLTCIAEKAFYQFNFLRASSADFDVVERQLTSFAVDIKTNQGINLISKPFSHYVNIISSPSSYVQSQLLGAAMRESHIHAFTYQSARHTEGMNVGLFTPKAFRHKKPNSHSLQSWQCISNRNTVEFVRSSTITREIHNFAVEEFMIKGKLPFPAN